MNKVLLARIKRICLLFSLFVLCGCTNETQMITEQSVRDFLHTFEALAAQRQFNLVEPHIHRDAFFRFNDGDFRGISEIKDAFEKTWETTSQATEDRYYLTDIVVLSRDSQSATATYTYNWEGKFQQREFAIQGRGTRVLVRTEDHGLQIIHEHLSRLPE